jgi:hypothetical protein
LLTYIAKDPNDELPMKTEGLTILFLFISFFSKNSFGQGRVVINEFMPWSGCNTTSEFIELMNFGPGPMNIGCYIVTNGTYAVTIPPNTIIQPGQYFVLSGQNTLSQGCGNTDSLIHVDLNWTSCNCTNTTIPVTGDGFMQNGGSANEKVVLMDPNLNIVDAVSRINPPGPSVSITTSAVSGGCTAKTFNLTNMAVSYETIGNSTGIDNSFARKVDGDCGWVKTTAISAHAPNKTGSSASTTYSFNTLSASDCQSTTGTISIQVSAADVNALFPMNYTLAYDADSSGTFTNTDTYLYGVDSSASSIDITNLAYGRYRITVGSSSSCNLKNFDFFIFNCYGVVLPLKLLYFKYDDAKNNQLSFSYKVADAASLKEVKLEAKTSAQFETVATQYAPFANEETRVQSPSSTYTIYRLRLKDWFGKISYSPEIHISGTSSDLRHWPNPVEDKLFVEVNAIQQGIITYSIFNSNGVKMKEDKIDVKAGKQLISLPVEFITAGIYYLRIGGTILTRPIAFTFIK